MGAAPRIDLSQLDSDATQVISDAKSLGVGRGLDPSRVLECYLIHRICHIVQEDSLAFAQELQFAEEALQNPSQFVKTPLDMIFVGGQPQPDSGFDELCSPEEKKAEFLARFEAYLETLQGSRFVVEDALLMADEIYTNGARHGLENKAVGTTRFIARGDEERLILGCIDSRGALDINAVASRVLNCYQTGIANSINQDLKGGAGIGSFLVFNLCTSIYYGVERNKRTIVLGALPLNMRRKKAQELTKNFHAIVID